MTDTLRKIAEAATRLQHVAEMKMADGLSLDLIGRCRATFGDLRLILDALQQKDATIERLERENERLRLAMLGGEDAPGYAASLPLSEVIRSHDDHQRMMRGLAEATIERMRAALEEIQELGTHWINGEPEFINRQGTVARDLLSTLQEIKGVGRAEGRDLQAAAIHVVGADQDRIELLAKHDPDIFRDVARWALRSPS